MSLQKATGIVIKRTEINDNDIILTMFSKERGKFQAIAKGVKKTKSPLIGSTQLFCYTHFVYYTGKTFDYVNETELLESFYKIRNDLERFAIATYMIEIVLHSFEMDQQEERVFNLLLYSLTLLNKPIRDTRLLLLAYQLKIVGLMGYAPNLDACSHCHRKMEEHHYSNHFGGLICGDCRVKDPYAKFIRNDAITMIDKLLFCPLKQINTFQFNNEGINVMINIMNQYITYHIDKKLFSYAFLETI
ncbi:MAG: DNA repair protein RecO [Eubacteriales bacterium]